MKVLPAAALALLLLPATLSAAPPRKWEYGPHCFLWRATAEAGAPPNGHPAQVDVAALKAALGSLRFVDQGKETSLFLPEEIERAAAALVQVLALARPGEDLELVSTLKRDRNWLAEGVSVVARVFLQDGRLNLIVHDTRLDWVTDFNLYDRIPSFDFGSRTRPGAVVLKADGATFPRPDWAVLPLTMPAVKPPAPQAPAPPMAAPAPPAPPAPGVEERLRGLKRFRDQNLITEEEYSRQKQDLLKEYAKGAN